MKLRSVCLTLLVFAGSFQALTAAHADDCNGEVTANLVGPKWEDEYQPIVKIKFYDVSQNPPELVGESEATSPRWQAENVSLTWPSVSWPANSFFGFPARGAICTSRQIRAVAVQHPDTNHKNLAFYTGAATATVYDHMNTNIAIGVTVAPPNN